MKCPRASRQRPPLSWTFLFHGVRAGTCATRGDLLTGGGVAATARRAFVGAEVKWPSLSRQRPDPSWTFLFHGTRAAFTGFAGFAGAIF